MLCTSTAYEPLLVISLEVLTNQISKLNVTCTSELNIELQRVSFDSTNTVFHP